MNTQARIGKRRAFASIVLLLLALLAIPATAQATPPLLTQFGNPGTGAGQTKVPRGVAVDPSTGNLYVAEQGNSRISEFTAWGEFLRAWGWGVADGAAKFETCGPKASPPTPTCQAGLSGAGAGQFAIGVQGVAIDGNHDVYIVDWGNHRVEKFDDEGHFLLVFGGDVDKTTGENVCIAGSGDECGIGTTGTGNGQFEAWPIGSFISTDASNTIYVGDKSRIQEFEADGTYLSSVPLPGDTVQSLVVDPGGAKLFVTFDETHAGQPGSKEDVRELSKTGQELAALNVKNPQALAVDSVGDLWVVNRVNPEVGGNSEILKFDPSGKQVDLDPEGVGLGFGLDVLREDTGLGTSSTACGISGTDLFTANASEANAFIRAYGPPPDPSVCPPAPRPPTIAAQFALSVDTQSATLKARINPHFWPDVTYYVQYGIGKCSEGGCESRQPLASGASLTKQVIDANVDTSGVFLPGLQPNTTYHYRFVAESSGGGPVFGTGEGESESAFHTFAPPPPSSPDSCPNAAYRGGASAGLADCRAYEMVSPLEKNNGDVSAGESTFAQAAAKGGAFTFSSSRAFGDPAGAPLNSQYLATREEGKGWSSHSISPPRASVSFYPTGSSANNLQYKAFSGELCDGWVLQDTDVALAPGAPAEQPDLYRRDFCGQGGYELLSSVAPPALPVKPFDSDYYLELQGFSKDGSHSVFRADAALTADACETPEIFQVYESLGEGALRLVSIPPGQKRGACTHSSVGIGQGKFGDFREDSVYHAVSEEGSRVFWSTSESSQPAKEAGGGGMQLGRLYLRVNATEEQSNLNGAGKCTEAARACTLKVSQLASSGNAQFWSGNPQASKALFSVGDLSKGEGHLYEYDLDKPKESERATLLAEGVNGVVGASEDLSRVYFISSKELAPGGVVGDPNLYLHVAGVGFSLVANLVGDGAINANSTEPTIDNVKPNQRVSRVSPDGIHAAFVSIAPLTGFDNTDARSGKPDAEVYLYDAVANGGEGSLACVSCDPSGALPRGREVREPLTPGDPGGWAAATIPVWASQLHPSQALSEDGKRLFFDSFGPLTQADTNGKEDVYEWEATGSGDCGEASAAFSPPSGGCLSLLTSGQSPEDSEFLDATPSGSDVFFTTQSSLLPQDYGLRDVYDARAGGGLPLAPSPAAACEGEACQGALSPPEDPTPGSSSFEGAGNVGQKPVNRHKKKANHKRKHRRANHKRRATR